MKKKDKEAFLRSITGTKPIQKKNNTKKMIWSIQKYFKTLKKNFRIK